VKRHSKPLTKKTGENDKALARLLKAIRSEVNETQSVWALSLGVSARCVVNWENGYRVPTRAQSFEVVTRLRDFDFDPKRLLELATLLGVDADITGLSLPVAAPEPLPEPPPPAPLPSLPPPQPPPAVEAPPPPPPIEHVRARINAAVYEAAEEIDIPLRALRRAVAIVLEATAASGALVLDAHSIVAQAGGTRARAKR
jgi:DNA-binding XRE family transcriptional regulator